MEQNRDIPTFAKKDRKLLSLTEWEFVFCISIAMLGGILVGIMLPV